MPDTQTIEATEIDFAQPRAASEVVPMKATEPPAPVAHGDPILLMIERAARDPLVDIDKMDRLLAMKERLEAKAAQVEFDRSMADAQSEMGPIRADMENKQTKSRYASYAQLDSAVRPIYSKYGFALSFNTGDAPNPNEVRVLCTVSHRVGHRQDYKIDMPADGKGPQGAPVMTRTHATGAGASYGQRYLLKLIFNLAVGDVDDDGNGAGGLDSDVEGMAGPNAPRDANGKLLSTYDVEKVNRARDWADPAVQRLNLLSGPLAQQEARAWRDEALTVPKGKRKSPLGWLKENAPGQYLRVRQVYQNVTGEDIE